MTGGGPLQQCLVEYRQWLPASVRDLCLDSRQVQPGDVFIALCGHQAHGLDYAAEAVARGAAVVLYEPVCERERLRVAQGPVPMVPIPDLRRRLPELAACFYGQPSDCMRLAGVTGTNGKTSIAWMTARALRQQGQACAYLGTLGLDDGQSLKPTLNTTPDVVGVNRFLAHCRALGLDLACMEISSHALEQNRVAGVRVRHAVFSNLSRDHLDAHGSMEVYGEIKARLLHQPGLETIWLNGDDPWCRSLAGRQPDGVRLQSFGDRPVDGSRLHLAARDVHTLLGGLAFDLDVQGRRYPVRAGLMGRFNVDNLLAVAGLLHDYGLDWPDIAGLLSASEPVPGRMQMLPGRRPGPAVVLDFAHTPDALEQVLSNLRPHVSGRLWCVFGCGGGRDEGKRPMMGAVAERLADRVVLTADNPRQEPLEHINEQILAGMHHPERAKVIPDRRVAVLHALQQAGAEDLVLLAGKGHEDFQDVAGQRHAYSDAAVVAEWREEAA